jgi:hypothetical protein
MHGAGTKLTPAEVDAAVDQVKSNLPADQTLTPAQLAQLRAALAQVNRATLVRVSTTAGGTTKPAANAAGSLPPDVLNGLLVGLRTTNGSMATNTSSEWGCSARQGSGMHSNMAAALDETPLVQPRQQF